MRSNEIVGREAFGIWRATMDLGVSPERV